MIEILGQYFIFLIKGNIILTMTVLIDIIQLYVYELFIEWY